MWMMGCSSDSSSLTLSDSCNARKLRPIIPKPCLLPTAATTSNTVSSYSWLALSNDEQRLSVFHSQIGEEPRRCELGGQVSSRWNPTPDQLRILDELYRRGTRTPSAEQIRYITGQLRRYGKIEGKNVFYWFQNHKARERQKRRRRTEAATELIDCFLERKDSAACCVGFEQSKDLMPTHRIVSSEESILFSRGERAQRPSEGPAGKNSLQFNGDCINFQQNPNIQTPDLNFPENSTPATTPIGEESSIETLQLFPLHTDVTNTSTSTTENSFTIPTFYHSHHNLIQFFQFLPLKN